MTSPPALRVVRGACPHDCPDTCATLTTVEGDRAVKFEADPDHPFTQGWLCAKVRPYLDRVDAPDRLLHPLRRAGHKGGGQWRRISWDEANAEITGRWREIIAAYGGAAILPYSFSGTLGLVHMDVAGARLWNRMGASGLERSICGAAAESAVRHTLGARFSPAPADVLASRLVVIWGHNPVSTSPHFMPFLQDAIRGGTRLVVIDPRRTATARRAHLHLQPHPATDGALALGLIHVIFAEGWHDEAWLEAHALGWRDLRDRAADYPPERVAAITGLDAAAIVDLARTWATSTPALVKFADGLQRHENGGQTIRAIVALAAVTGQIGRRGGGVSYSTSGYAAWDEEAVGHASACPPQPRVVNMNRLGAALTGEACEPPVMSLLVFGSNPVASSPASGKIVAGLCRDDLFTVVHEQFMTDTADYADIVLPATTQLEQVDLHRPYGLRSLQYNARAIPPRGECRSNWDLMRTLAAGMGYTEPWLHEDAREVIRGVLDASRAANPALAGITLERLEAEGLEPLPAYVEPAEFRAAAPGMLTLITGAAHHFVTTSFANQPGMLAGQSTFHSNRVRIVSTRL